MTKYRYSFISKTISLFLLIIIGLSFSAFGLEIYKESDQQVRGVVFLDANKNGLRERHEKGIAGVAVSNGVDVVQTNKKGEYILPCGEDNIIFVIKPEDYTYHVDENNLPQFYYIHKPKGSPTLTYPGVSPTGDLPLSVDFGLLPYEEKDEFKIVVFGDPQPKGLDEIYFLEKSIIEELVGTDEVSFGISLGDIVNDYLHLNEPYIRAIKRIGVPWHHVLGNHDINKDVKEDRLSDETFESYYGPTNYSFNYGNVHFIVLDNILYPDPRKGGRRYGAGFREDQMLFVKNNLAFVDTTKLVVVAMHIPLLDAGGFGGTGRQKLFDLLQDYPHTLVLSGHTHIQRQNFYGEKDGWYGVQPLHEYNVATASGNWNSGEFNDMGIPDATMPDGTPRGYAYLNFKGNEYSIDYKVAGRPLDYRMEIFTPLVVASSVHHNRTETSRIAVNFFIGSKKDLVEYRISGGEWKKMSYTEDYDPTYLNLLHRWDYATELMLGRRPSNPSKSTHLWMSLISSKLPVGMHVVEVRVTDMFGRVFVQEKEFRVEEPKQRPAISGNTQ